MPPQSSAEPIAIVVDRFNAESYFHEDGERQGLMNVKHAYTLDEDIREFDASFFKTNAREAEAMDPQQRILLETVYEALESGGFSIGDMQGSDTCVYVGSMTGDYHEMLMRDPQDMPKYMATGTARSILSNRISYFFDWRGPSMTIDTACSSSLVAVHEAVQALRLGTSKVACAAGANLILGPEMMISESKLHMLSPTGRSRMWDASADGYARGEGFGAVILKTLSQAIADKDNIHCIIRETGVNSDGRTNGITLPSSESQTTLIRQTYARAGLDWNKDKCQYFEAHGTGTPAGDPIEARAIHDAFFPSKTTDGGDVMYVGSVKTVVGHLEGCAGIAGLIKASEAVRRGVIPPNMLFEKLNPGITPYYKNLKVPQQPVPWPETKDGALRRASVNSFGFGGTNAHAIIESYVAGNVKPAVQKPESIIPNPLLLSATSTSTLKRMLSTTRDFLASDRSTPLQDVLFTLGERRSQHAVRAAFAGHSRERLIEKLQIALDDDSWTGTNVDAKVKQPRILGVFTGQGAQWPTMGREILKSDQILADKSNSRLAEAAVAQPLCTAVQVMLVDLLSLAGVQFNVVLGHSSGEIGAAYAAGMISAEEAIRIAYYRGVHASLARGSTGKPGAMMAVGLSYDEASDFVEQNFPGRIDVAASNAPASVTLSGDKDAIQEAQAIFQDQGTFARLLQVDTAYHSSHMMPCAEPYMESLAACKIEPKQPREGCTWFSSVYGDRMEGDMIDSLTGEYWKDNMVNPVLFSMAVELAANGELPCDVALEVGPHPALKAPFTQTYKQTGAAELPYQGVLGRGKHDVECIGEALGFLWTYLGKLGSSGINFRNFTKAFDSDSSPQLATNLPAYPWDHSQSFWKESRKSRNFRSKPDVRHPLLGDRSTEDIDQSMVWRNILRIEELPWLDGHRVEGQVIYPAAGYLVMALESCNALALGREVELIELYDVEIGNAIPLSEETPGVETLFTLKPAKLDPKADTTIAEWACYSPAGDLNAPWRCNASGSVRVVFGAADDDALPRRVAPVVSLSNVEIDRFYTSLTEIGLNYTGPFRALEEIHRKSGMSSSTATQAPAKELSTIIHPAILDAAFQSIFAAFCWPGDGTLRAPYVPTKLRKLRIVNRRLVESARSLQVDSYVTESSAQNLTADLDIFESDTNKGIIQLESLTCTALVPAGPRDYKELYTRPQWELDVASAVASLPTTRGDNVEDLELVDLCERLTYYYLRQLNDKIDRSEVPAMVWHFQRIFEWIDYLFPWIEEGTHPTIRKEWKSDTYEWLDQQRAKFPGQVDLQLITAVGENLAEVVRGQTTMLEHMIKDDVLNRFYKFGLGFQRANGFMGRIAKQVAHRYPRMKILEIGAGTGGATKGILESLGTTFESYTFTDISTGFFEAAAEAFAPWVDKMIFKPLNAENDVIEQGYTEKSYDFIIASNVLHATKTLSETMRNVRRLLKPGGHLLLLEVTSEIVRVKLMMAGLSGWWLGGDDGRRYGPTITRDQWDSLLKNTGFSGVDHVIHDFVDESKYMTSVMISQAVDSDVALLRQPLLTSADHPVWTCPPITIVGGAFGNVVSRTVKVLSAVPGLNPQIKLAKTLAEVASTAVPTTAIVILEDLDEPVLQRFTQEKLTALQKTLPESRQLLWVSHKARSDDPYGNLSVGLCRGLSAEYPHVAVQHIDFEDDMTDSSVSIIAGAVIRLIYAAQRKFNGEVLWTSEPELLVKDGKLQILRILPDTLLNDRLNAHKMTIKNIASVTKDVIDVFTAGDRYVLSTRESTLFRPADASLVKVKVSHSLASAVRLNETTSAFLSAGHLEHNPAISVVALSSTNSSTISVPSGCVFKVAEGSNVATLLQDVTSALIADQLISDIPLGSTVVLHRSDKFLGAVLKRKAAKAGLSVKNIGLHKYASEKSLRDVVPASTRILIDFSAVSHWANSLPEGCVYRNVQDFFSHSPKGEPILVAESVRRLVDLAQLQPSTSSTVDILPLAKLASQSVSATKYSTIIDFSDVSAVPAQTAVLNPATLFRSDHTYLLAGCTGGLGKALCVWMASKGAKYFALTTRDPSKIDQLWLKELAALGAEVNLYGLDVADKDALTAVRGQIEEEMPPIAGVVNAAMVLSDRSFGELTAKDFRTVFGPKVDGTKNLDELFYDQPLDFFIMFSSLASIVGNRGQSNYVAANLFMSTIAEQRRRRGLAASVIHIGMVLGVGYVSSTGIYESTLRQYNYMPIPEQDFLDMFSEAIVVGRLESEHSPDLITGLNRHSLREDVQRPFWHEDLKFCHHTLTEVRQTEATATNNMSLAQRLSQATSPEEVEELIQEGFCTKLERMLQAAKGSIQVSQSLMNLGVDSLIAVEIRSWFLKELDVDVPVLKVLSGASVTDLSKEAASKVTFGTEAASDAASPAIAAEKESPRVVPQILEPTPLIAPSAVTTAPHSTAPSVFDGPSSPSSRGVSPPRSASDVTEIETKVKREQLKVVRVAEMSFAQRRLWFLRQFLQDPTTYNVTLSYSITGRLRINDFREAFRKVIARHESLRTCLYNDPETNIPTQAVFSDAIFDIDYKTGTTVEREFSKMRDHVFDLENGENMRAVIISESESKHFFVLGFHHLAFDGFSAQTLVKDLAMAYTGLPLSPLKHQYIDFANKEKTLTWSDDLEYWKSEFAELPETLPLFEFTETKARIPLTEYNTRALTQQLPDRIASQIKSAARSLNVTPFHFHLAITQTLLSRLLDITDVCVGITDANKNDSEFLDTIGFFVNLLPLRFKTDGSQSFANLATAAKDKVHQALSHSRVPFDKLLDELKVPRSTSHSPLFQVVVNYKMGSTQSVPLAECQAQTIEFEDARNAYDLSFEIENFPDGGVLLALKTQDYLYTDHDLQTILATYTHLLDALSREPNLNVNAVELAPSTSRELSLQLARGETYEPAILHLPGWLDHWTAQQPDAIAIRDDCGATLSYRDATARVNDIAALLIMAGAKTGQRVGSYCEPSIDAICTLLAIQKLGCIYVPLDVQNPVPRLNLILKDCQPSLLVCHDATEPSVQQFETSASLVSISKATSETAAVDASVIDPSTTGYILYTSGTTGIPKGVMLSHSNLINHIAGVYKKYGLKMETVLQQSSFGFDLSLAQICQAFFSGGTLVIALKETRRDPAQLAKLMLEEKITYTWMTPTEYSMIVRYGANYLRQSSYWRSAFSSGEVMSANLLNSYIRLEAPCLRLFNGYGPTEISINSCIGEDELSPLAPRDTRNPSIGKSLPNYSTYVLDENLKPVPVGFPGEICVGGPAVAQGYLDRDELTAAKFQPDPYGPGHLYRTGDKAKFLPDGRLVFLGRIAGDTQVKLRGFRVELDDIANTIIKASEGIVKDASVSFRRGQDSSEDFLAAFVILAAKEHTVSDGPLEQLRLKLPLPAYMRPARIIAVDELPVNSSGKRDRHALDMLPISSISSTAESGHLTRAQVKLRELWLEVVPSVDAATIGANTDFFAIGGNSLLMVKLRGLIAETFDIEISVFDLFQSSSLGNMASKVQSSEVDQVISWEEETSVQPLSVVDGNVLQQVSDSLEILLTGATGFLGSSILRQLVADERVSKVHCVALRGIHPLAVESPKIIQYTGNLSHKLLGLSETEFSTLSSRVHRIIHNGATVSFLQSYSSLREPNFESTKTLVSLAASRGIPLHYVSSAGVVKFTGLDGLPPVSVSQHEPPTDGSNGYSATKWASEVYLEKVTENTNLPIWIHRPSSITGENAPETDLMQSVIKHSLNLQAIPDLSSWQGSFDFVPVDDVAAGIIAALYDVGQGLSFAHHCGKDKIPVHELKQHLEKENIIKLDVLSLEQWVDKAKDRGLLDNAAEVLINDVVGISDGKAILPSLL
ncbi:putative Hybrid PKS-NRPS biosynthetic cluster [Trichoderma virens]|nr:putative Hybrid PKS-NRPS biosynthetic cluster [Trichoderma virens]